LRFFVLAVRLLHEQPSALNELVDANGGIQNVRVEPATGSAAATFYSKKKILWSLNPVCK